MGSRKCAECGNYFWPENKRHRFCCDACRKRNWDRNCREQKASTKTAERAQCSLSIDSGQRVEVVCPRAATCGREGVVLGTLPSGYVMVALIDVLPGGWWGPSLDGRESKSDWKHVVYKYKPESLENV